MWKVLNTHRSSSRSPQRVHGPTRGGRSRASKREAEQEQEPEVRSRRGESPGARERRCSPRPSWPLRVGQVQANGFTKTSIPIDARHRELKSRVAHSFDDEPSDRCEQIANERPDTMGHVEKRVSHLERSADEPLRSESPAGVERDVCHVSYSLSASLIARRESLMTRSNAANASARQANGMKRTAQGR